MSFSRRYLNALVAGEGPAGWARHRLGPGVPWWRRYVASLVGLPPAAGDRHPATVGASDVPEVRGAVQPERGRGRSRIGRLQPVLALAAALLAVGGLIYLTETDNQPAHPTPPQQSPSTPPWPNPYGPNPALPASPVPSPPASPRQP
ncbi:hypothetical protein GCM10010441_75420 [Kitasatospora paracochleata]|uniref:Serine/threonine protein kinase n=1 Tax=Kitasatospora paracochleata TaxID=58354 RepID=A0ABT1J9W7_9ACTN|nr:hypothetical protein [Kitasatospora paracochleata]MCP2314255.1 hypothetical protein [Kitasatospora paracochleata]